MRRKVYILVVLSFLLLLLCACGSRVFYSNINPDTAKINTNPDTAKINTNPIVGQWLFRADSSTTDKLRLKNSWSESKTLHFYESSIITFYNDGTWKMTRESGTLMLVEESGTLMLVEDSSRLTKIVEYSGTYSIGHDGTAISIVATSEKDNPSIEFVDLSFSGNEMHWTYSGETLVFTK